MKSTAAILCIILCLLLYPVLSSYCEKNKELIVQKDGFTQQKRTKYTKYQKPYVYAFYPVAQKFCPQSPKVITKMIIDFIGVCLSDTRILRHISQVSLLWCRFSSDDQWVVGQRVDHRLILWHVETGQSKELEVRRMYSENTVRFTSDNQQIVFVTMYKRPWKTIEIIHVTTGSHVRSIDLEDDVNYISLSTDDKFILPKGRSLYHVQVWDRETGLCIRTFASWFLDRGMFAWGKFCNNNRDIISCTYYDTFIRIRNIRWPWWGMRKLYHNDRINTCQLSADQTLLVSGSDDQTACVWHLPKGKKCQTFRHHATIVINCYFVLNDTQVVSMDSASNLYIWRVTDGSIIHSFRQTFDMVHPFARSYWIANKNIEYIIVKNKRENKLKLLNIESGNEILQTNNSSNNYETRIGDVSSDGRFMIVEYWNDDDKQHWVELRDVQLMK